MPEECRRCARSCLPCRRSRRRPDRRGWSGSKKYGQGGGPWPCRSSEVRRSQPTIARPRWHIASGRVRHDSRYSAIDMSVWLRASKDRAKALNRESLYMIPLHDMSRRTTETSRTFGAFPGSNQQRHADSIGHSPDSLPQCAAQAGAALSTSSKLNSSSKPANRGRISSDVASPPHPGFYRSRTSLPTAKPPARMVAESD